MSPVARPGVLNCKCSKGTVLGSNSGVEAYSCDYDTWHTPRAERSWRNYYDGVFTGAKWQCVEYARRWLLLTRGYTFADIPMAYHILELDHVTVQRGKETQLKTIIGTPSPKSWADVHV